MTASFVLGTGAALAFVLGLVLVLSRFLGGRLRAGSARAQPGRVEVISRVGLAPRQGVATIRVDGRSAVVSYGEGGVRLLFDLSEDDAARAERSESDGDALGTLAALGATGAVGVKRPTRRFHGLRAFLLGLTLLVAVSDPVSARMSAPAAAVVAQTAPAREQQKSAAAAGLPDVRLSVGRQGEEPLELSGPVGTVLFVGFLTLLPTLLLLTTSFTRILIVLHLLKQALGTQTAPPAHLLAAMALILTGFVMAPTLKQANDQAIAPWMAGDIETGQMLREAAVPFRTFMLRTTREQDLAQFVDMSDGPAPASADDVPLVTLTAAFVTSELTSAFQMGFALFLPFVVIDVVVASVLMSMGMFMLPPVMVSLPFKLLLFVLVDGWSLIMGSLVRSFA